MGRELDEDELIGNWTRGKPLGGPGSGPYPSAMTTLAPGDRFRLWPAVWPLVRILVLSVPDLPSRRKARRAIRDLARGCDP